MLAVLKGVGMAATSSDPFARLEATIALGARVPSKRMLIIVNPYATTVSDRLKNLVVYALRGSYQVDAIDTEARDHATEHLLGLVDDWRPRKLDLAHVNDRGFLFSAGVGLDASVVERVDAHPRLKARLGEWYYTWVTLGTFNRRYLLHPPKFEVEVGSERVTGVTAVIQNGAPYTYFGDRPVNMGIGAALDSGDLAGAVLRRRCPCSRGGRRNTCTGRRSG